MSQHLAILPNRTGLSLALATLLAGAFAAAPAQAAGQLSIELNAPYNVVVDSNVCSPSTYAPQIATIGAAVCNYGDAPLTDVVARIGNYTAGTAGFYPTRNSATGAGDVAVTSPCLADSGLYGLQHVGDLVDATRYVGTLGVGECKWQYWSFTYPRRENPDTCGDPVWCASNNPNDDLWLPFDVWATSAEGSAANTTWRVTMRNEISASANKIFPNGASWYNEPGTCWPGETVTTNGINYELGTVRFGFDNNGDLQPDYNAWLQPIGDPNWNPACFRLVDTRGQLQISTTSGTVIQDFENSLYFTDLPQDNNGILGVVFYTFMCLDGACAVPLTPYQEAASGYDNEKFAGDYGTPTVTMTSRNPEVELDKSVVDATADGRAAPGERLDYTITLDNNGPVDAGNPDLGVPLVIRDKIPAGTRYLAGSASAAFPCCGVTILYSTDNGAGWSSTQPSPATLVTDLMWRLQDPFPTGATGSVSFSVTVNDPYSGAPVILNTGTVAFGDSPPFDEDTVATPVVGSSNVGNLVFRDDGGTTGTPNNGVRDGDEALLADIGLTLYWDRNGDGLLDAGDLPLLTTSSSGSTVSCGPANDGNYCFANIAAGDYLVVVDTDDAQIPQGFRLTTPAGDPTDTRAATGLASGASNNTADFGFGPSLVLTKSDGVPNPAIDGQLVTYNIQATNVRPTRDFCTYTVWGETAAALSNFINSANAANPQGPDGLYARGGEGGGGDQIQIEDYSLAGASGTPTSVVLQLPLYLGGILSNDDLDVTVRDGVGQTLTRVFTTAELNTAAPGEVNKRTLTWDVSSIFQTLAELGSAEVFLDYKHNGGPDNVTLFLDSIGFEVTTDALCGAPGDDMQTVPLTDTYDADALQFLAATPPVSGSSVSGAAPNQVGTLTWNLGPLFAQQTKTVTVQFRARQHDDQLTDGNLDGENDFVTHGNTASITNAFFFDGGAVNDASDTGTHTVNPTGSISGLIWADANSNGVQDPGESVIPFATVELRDGVCTPGATCPTDVTDAAGGYSFTNLAAGTYTVVVITSTLPGSPPPVQTGDPDEAGVCVVCDDLSAQTVVLNNGDPADDDITGVDFGYVIPAAILGTVWNDVDADGTIDGGEALLANVTVRLFTPGGDGLCGGGDDVAVPVVSPVTTDANGRYVFEDLTPDTYCVEVDPTTLPAGSTWAQTFDPDGTLDSRFRSAPAAPLTVVASTIYGPFDFGYRQTGTSVIGDTLYADWNGDGDQDPGEEGIPNVTITLIQDVNGDGVRDCGADGICGTTDDVDAVRAVTVTAADGTYSFTGLPAGSWIVQVDEGDPDFLNAYTNLVQTQDPDQPGVVCSVCDGKGSATTNGTNTVLTVDFGYRPIGFASLGDFVWNDVDGDGIQDPGEPGLANIQVTVYEDEDGDGVIDPEDAVVGVTITDGSGLYHLFVLPQYDYIVDVDQNDTQLPVDSFGNPFVLSTGNDPLAVTLGLNEDFLDADFGFTAGATIGDKVYRDDNGDGDQAPSEPGINGVTVQLYRDDGDGIFEPGTGDVLVTTRVTATDPIFGAGYYLFTGLPAGSYFVNVVEAGIPFSPTIRTADPDPTLDGRTLVSVIPGTNVRYADFGYQPPNVVGDRIWRDIDGDGNQEEVSPGVFLEPGIPGITVQLLNSGGTVIGSTTTDADGFYSFGNLANGTYTIRVNGGTVPAGFTQTFEPDVGLCGGTCNRQVTVTLNGGPPNLVQDFGFRRIPTLEIDKDTTTPAVSRGGQITYTIHLRNVGDATATAATLSDTLPALTSCSGGPCFTFVGASTQVTVSDPSVVRTATSNPAGGATSLTWGTWTIPGGESLTLSFRVAVNLNTPLGTYDNTAASTYNNGTTNVTIDDVGTQGGDSNTVQGQDPETDEDVTITAVGLTIDKTSVINGAAVDPGETVQYTIVVTNNGTATATQVTISDGVPNGTTYVPNSSVLLSVPTDIVTTYADNFDDGVGGTDFPNGNDGTANFVTAWTADGAAALSDQGDFSLEVSKNDDPHRTVDLTNAYTATVRFDYRRFGLDAGDSFDIRLGGTLLGTLTGSGLTGTSCSPNPGGLASNQTDPSYLTLTCTVPAALLGANRILELDANQYEESPSERVFVDNLVVEKRQRQTSTNVTASPPPTPVPASAGYTLRPGESMTLRFDVTADNPLPTGMTQLVNTAFADSLETPPVSDFTNDPVNNPNAGTGGISGTVYDDDNPTDGSFAGLGSEPVFQNIRVELWQGTTQIAVTLTDANGFYQFLNLPAASNYEVRVITSNLPSGYQQSGDPDVSGQCSGTACDNRSTQVVSTSVVTGVDFGYFYNPTALPVTLSSFAAGLDDRGDLRISWTTETEVRNVGFHVFGDLGGEWVQLTDELVPSKAIDSVEPLTYSVTLPYVDATSFLLMDVDVKGVAQNHGPFAFGDTEISEPPAIELIPWGKIRSEHATKDKARRGKWGKKDFPTVRLIVEEDGLYRVTYEDLLAAGVDMKKVPLAQIALSDRDGAVPIWIDGKGTFGPGKAIEFYGRAQEGLYTDGRHYTLRLDPKNALRAAIDRTAPSKLGVPVETYLAEAKVDQDTAYNFTASNGDPWFHRQLRAIYAPATTELGLELNDVAASAPATLELEMWGMTDWPGAVDHHLLVYLNDSFVAEDYFDDTETHRMSVPLTSGVVREGVNTLRIELPLDQGTIWDLVALESYGVRYPRRLIAQSDRLAFTADGATSFRVKGLSSPDVGVYRVAEGALTRFDRVQVSGSAGAHEVTFPGHSGAATYVVATGAAKLKPAILAVPEPEDIFSGEADYLVIAHPNFEDGIRPLVDHRAAQGLSTQIVSVEQVYENLSAGEPDPIAIQEYIAYAVAEKGTDYVVLVGGDTYDYKNYLGLGALSFIPSLYVPTHEYVQFAPADPLYGDVDGDLVPDVAVGRFPVRTDAELAAMVAKTLTYESKSYRRTMVSATDGYDTYQRLSFLDLGQDLLDTMPPGWSLSGANMDELGLTGARDSLVGAINQGRALTQFLGHSSYNLWSFSRLFTGDHAQALTNHGRPTVVAQWACWNTYYVHPYTTTLGHNLLVRGEQGAAAVLGAATLTATDSEMSLAQSFLPLAGQTGTTIGEALIAAKQSLASDPAAFDVIISWTILGDPALAIDQDDL